MKHLYLILLIFSPVAAFSQNYVISPSNTVDKVIEVGAFEYGNINLAHDNTTADSIELNWELLEVTVPASWDRSICDYTNCYAANITSGTMSKIGNGQSGFVKVNVNADVAGSGYFKFKVWKTSTPSVNDTLTFNFIASEAGISDLELGKKVNVYPNPSNGEELTINNILPETKVSIINSLGQSVYTIMTSESTIQLSNLDLNRGVYFVKLSRSNKSYTTRKLIVK